ncbi:MAG: hypothetical protein ACUVTB_05675 [Candidatus Bathycorpusculaceae bacterium]
MIARKTREVGLYLLLLNPKISVRRHGLGDIGLLTVKEFIKTIKEEIFNKLSLDALVRDFRLYCS